MTHTGYEGPEEHPEPVKFRFEEYTSWPSATGLTCRLFRNDRAVGMVNLETQEEYLFLKARIDSNFDPEVESVGNDIRRTDEGDR